MSLRPLPAGSTGNNLKVTQGNSLKPGGQRLEGHKGLTNTSVPKLQIVEFGKMYRFLTTSAKATPILTFSSLPVWGNGQPCPTSSLDQTPSDARAGMSVKPRMGHGQNRDCSCKQQQPLAKTMQESCNRPNVETCSGLYS
ncbi:hypothetical protein Anapl_15751 [Anas platyrhynchos]|uniref:Uncharacterized protein n=1 Tax=Anas platyrhynchos TaxID=8839 RepID=R0JX20_ANAPL|nr:hypothetical protein Anapl_15751 [Anas platyrhynchos]